jgi:hypothetical protein
MTAICIKISPRFFVRDILRYADVKSGYISGHYSVAFFRAGKTLLLIKFAIDDVVSR